MGRLYFDLCYDDILSRDEEGGVFDSVEAARHAAVQSLLEIARGGKCIGDATELMFVVRDAADRQAFTARLMVLVTP